MQWKYKKEVPIAALLQNLQVIGFSPADLERAVDLLHEKESDELMRERKMRERKAQISTSPDLICKPKGSPDEKSNMALACDREAVNLCRKLLRG